MSPRYVLAITGKLRSPQPGASRQVKFFNTLWDSVDIFRVDVLGRRHFVVTIYFRDITGTPVNAFDGEHFIVASSHTGGFIMTVDIKAGQDDYRITTYDLVKPYDIGPVPTPTRDIPIPPDSPRVVTGVGLHPKDTLIVREQYWARLAESYMLAPLEKKTVSYTTSSGLQETSSEQTTVDQSLSVGVSGGWGPISASINASLNVSSTTSHQVTVTEERSTFLSDNLENQRDKPVMYLRWQLTDVISLYGQAVPQGASVVLGQNPVLIYGPYVLDELPVERAFEEDYAALTPEQRAALEESLLEGQSQMGQSQLAATARTPLPR